MKCFSLKTYTTKKNTHLISYLLTKIVLVGVNGVTERHQQGSLITVGVAGDTDVLLNHLLIDLVVRRQQTKSILGGMRLKKQTEL
jgi:hypothetical protein